MLGLHALNVPAEAVLISEIFLIIFALFAIFSGGSRSQIPKTIICAIGIAGTLSIGRVLFDPIPNVQPVTIGILLVGATYGARRGIGIAFLVAVFSNMVIGTGVWTLFQAGAWGIIAVVGSIVANQLIINEKINLSRLVFAGIISAFIFDFLVSLSVLIADPTPNVFIAYLITGLPFDLLHAAGNVMIAVTLGPSMYGLLSRSLSSTGLKIRSVVNESRIE
ncbi:MAG: hypothetical protein QGH13_00925 [Candidatus Thalassarchaeaceae archaeon]|nr:hypothetical protein [Candidatus Thalassarchaeaceae archaeon]